VRLLTLDIETRPNLGYIWGLWDQNVGISQLVEVSSVICFAAKWHGDKKVHFASDFHDGHEEMVRRVHGLMSEADAIIGWNSKAFDNKRLNREFELQRLGPPAPYVDIDLLRTARRSFGFASNKLDHVAQDLGIGSKVKHDGFDLWKRCMADDPKAWARMKKYNIGDVLLTEKVYDRFLPWIQGHPHPGLFGGAKAGCPNCGSMELQMRGSYVTQACRYQRFQCQACGKFGRGPHRRDATQTRAV
jgi:DNA polymerase elongation subunit (family B)